VSILPFSEHAGQTWLLTRRMTVDEKIRRRVFGV
jgi:hypothetical protein